jgi:NAD(P)-dependent dehydrogenase (short-subunit alcohol dehydrogenase family)
VSNDREQLRLDGKVAVVTGAGHGLGRAYALLLAQQGASVVVNDIGVSKDGQGRDAAPATQVTQEIRRLGGRAVANTSNVADEADAAQIISCAVEEFGGLDILINNAGILQPVTPPLPEAVVFEHVIRVNMTGSFLVTKAAWPHLTSVAGRVIMTTSGALFGSPAPAYSTAKAGILGLARSFALMGEPHGVKVNVICPIANTRLIHYPSSRLEVGIPGGSAEIAERRHAAQAVAPLALLLSHASCSVNGEVISSDGVTLARIQLEVSDPEDADLTASQLGEWLEQTDHSDAITPVSGADYVQIRAQQSIPV